MQKRIIKIVKSDSFQSFIIGSIVLASVLIGLETFPEIVLQYDQIFKILDRLICWIFIGEFILKIAAEGRKPWRYFSDPWNVFDFAILFSFFLPINSQYVLVLRLARILRVLKLVRALPRLQVLVGALLKSLPSMVYVSLLLLLLFYTYGVSATFMFSQNDPVHFGSLPRAILSLFQIVTLEGWSEIMYTQMYGCDRYGYDGMEYLCTTPSASPIVSAFFFVSFVMLGAMIVINLFIGVMTSSLEEAHREQQGYNEEEMLTQIQDAENSVEVKLAKLQAQLDRIEVTLERLGKNVAPH